MNQKIDPILSFITWIRYYQIIVE